MKPPSVSPPVEQPRQSGWDRFWNGVGGAVSSAGRWTGDRLSDAGNWVYENRGTVATVVATGACFIPAVGQVGCAGFQAAAFGVRTQQTIQENGWSTDTAMQVGLDAVLTTATLGSASSVLNRSATLLGGADDAGRATVALRGTNARGTVTSRGSFRSSTLDDAWENAAPGPSGGRLCPTCSTEVHVPPNAGRPRDWDGSHNPSWTNRTFPEDVTRPQVLDDFQRGVFLECPACNRGGGNNDFRFDTGG